MRFIGGVLFEKKMIDNYSLFVTSDEEKYEGGGSSGNEEITSDKEEVVNDDKESDDEDISKIPVEVTVGVGIGGG